MGFIRDFMSRLNRTVFGAGSSPVDSFLSQERIINGEWMNYSAYFNRHLPDRLTRERASTESAIPNAAGPRLQWLSDNAQEIRAVQQELGNFTAMLESMRRDGFVASHQTAAASAAVFTALDTWLDRQIAHAHDVMDQTVGASSAPGTRVYSASGQQMDAAQLRQARREAIIAHLDANPFAFLRNGQPVSGQQVVDLAEPQAHAPHVAHSMDLQNFYNAQQFRDVLEAYLTAHPVAFEHASGAPLPAADMIELMLGREINPTPDFSTNDGVRMSAGEVLNAIVEQITREPFARDHNTTQPMDGLLALQVARSHIDLLNLFDAQKRPLSAETLRQAYSDAIAEVVIGQSESGQPMTFAQANAPAPAAEPVHGDDAQAAFALGNLLHWKELNQDMHNQYLRMAGRMPLERRGAVGTLRAGAQALTVQGEAERLHETEQEVRNEFNATNQTPVQYPAETPDWRERHARRRRGQHPEGPEETHPMGM